MDRLALLGRWDDAAKIGLAACLEHKNDAELVLKTARVLWYLRKSGQALSMLEVVPASLRADSLYWTALAQCHHDLGSVDKARESYVMHVVKIGATETQARSVVEQLEQIPGWLEGLSRPAC
jgi:predicted Zn-dependent protease